MDSDHGLTLARGACRMWCAAAGTELTAVRGSARITEACRPVADHTVSRSTPLDPGRPHRIEDPGWITVSAMTDCELRVRAMTPVAPTRTWHAWRRMMAALRSTLAVAPGRTL